MKADFVSSPCNLFVEASGFTRMEIHKKEVERRPHISNLYTVTFQIVVADVFSNLQECLYTDLCKKSFLLRQAISYN